MELIDNTTGPRFFTPVRIERLAIANAAVRALRALGLTVTDEEPFPEDGGTPILQIDLHGMPPEYLRGLCDASTCHADGRITAQFLGVRLVMRRGEVRHDR
ncbi:MULTISPECIES: hypothetical protein [Achromobacter]|uniref:Uncharacterized protein n=1 Tax=Achromobacter denitrificans TaxID=32002 RepID=A0ABZ3GBK3_ACHDE|nr:MULTISPECIES: hypothetical protein [Achromobacter]